MAIEKVRATKPAFAAAQAIILDGEEANLMNKEPLWDAKLTDLELT